MGTWTTTPRTWVAGEIPTATHFNSDVRDFGRAFADAWTSYTPTLTASTTSPTGWTQNGYYMRAGKLVICKFTLTAGASMTAGSGDYRVALPANVNTTIPLAVGMCDLYDSSGGVGIGHAQVFMSASTYCQIRYQAAYPTGAMTTVGSAAPWTWAANDTIMAAFAYEAA